MEKCNLKNNNMALQKQYLLLFAEINLTQNPRNIAMEM